MSIQNLNNSPQANAPMDGVKGRNQLNKDDFMKLFLTQLKTQSPLKPNDTGAMIQQMAQLTSLSATEDLQKTIQNLNASMGKSQILQASQLIGKKVQVPGKVSPLVSGEGLRGSVILPKPADEVTITIKDSNDKVVKVITKGASGQGVLDFDWDGLDAEQKQLEPGFYNISASAKINGQQTELLTAGTFKINSVALNPIDNKVILNVDGLGGIKMDEIIKII